MKFALGFLALVLAVWLGGSVYVNGEVEKVSEEGMAERAPYQTGQGTLVSQTPMGTLRKTGAPTALTSLSPWLISQDSLKLYYAYTDRETFVVAGSASDFPVGAQVTVKAYHNPEAIKLNNNPTDMDYMMLCYTGVKEQCHPAMPLATLKAVAAEVVAAHKNKQ